MRNSGVGSARHFQQRECQNVRRHLMMHDMMMGSGMMWAMGLIWLLVVLLLILGIAALTKYVFFK